MTIPNTTVELPAKPISASDIEAELSEGLEEVVEETKEILELKTDDEPVIEDDDEKEELEEKKEDEEEKEEELEIKDEDENELEYSEIPSRKTILKEFPELYKKFPQIERAVYREQQYAEVFPTINDAKAASVAIEQFNGLKADVLDGNIKNLLQSVKKADETAFKKIADDYLMTLLEVDKDAYMESASNIIKATLHNVSQNTVNAKKDSPEEQLAIAAKLLHKYFFNTHEIKPVDLKRPDSTATETNESTKLNKERQEFELTRFNTALTNTEERITKAVKNTVEKAIDPKGSMTDYVKNKAIEDVLNETLKQVGGDKRFKGILDKLWVSARDNGYNEESLSKIRKAVSSKAKTILPGIINKVKGDALKGQATRTKEASESRDNRPVSSGRPAASSNAAKSSKEIPRGMSTLDFFNS